MHSPKEPLLVLVSQKHYPPYFEMFFLPSLDLSTLNVLGYPPQNHRRLFQKFHMGTNTVEYLLRSVPWSNPSVPYSAHEISSPSLIVFPFIRVLVGLEPNFFLSSLFFHAFSALWLFPGIRSDPVPSYQNR